MLAPVLGFQRQHAVPLWIDQLMCAAAATPGADQWLADSIVAANFSNLVGFSWWTWKAGAKPDPPDSSMGILAPPPSSTHPKRDLAAFQIDVPVYELYRQVFDQDACSHAMAGACGAVALGRPCDLCVAHHQHPLRKAN